MRRFRFSVAALMAMILLLAIGMAALRDPTTLWASTIFTAAVILFAASLLGAMIHRGVPRFSWAGLAIFGWVYLIISFGPWPGNAVGPPRLLPSAFLHDFQEFIVSDGKTPYTTDEPYLDFYKATTRYHRIPGAMARVPPGLKHVDLSADRQIGHSLGSMLFGVLGALVGRFFAARRERSANDG